MSIGPDLPYAEAIEPTPTGDDLPVYKDAGERWFLGRLAGAPKYPRAGPQWSAAGKEVIPFSQIPDFDYRPTQLEVLDQNGHGACVGFGTTQAFQMTRLWSGQKDIPLAPYGLYSHINGGRDQGAIPSDAISWLCNYGIELDRDVPNYTLQGQISTEAKIQAMRFRASRDDCFQLMTFEEIATAMYLRYAIIFTITVGGAFTPDPQTGLVNYTRGVGNHLVCGGAKKTGDRLWGLNSWKDSWGIDGCFSFVRRHIDDQPNHDCWGIRNPMIDPLDVTNPPA